MGAELWAPKKAVAIGRALEPIEREAARERQSTLNNPGTASENFTEASRGEALDRVAAVVGVSRPTLAKAREVVDAAEAEPGRYRPGGCRGATRPTRYDGALQGSIVIVRLPFSALTTRCRNERRGSSLPLSSRAMLD